MSDAAIARSTIAYPRSPMPSAIRLEFLRLAHVVERVFGDVELEATARAADVHLHLAALPPRVRTRQQVWRVAAAGGHGRRVNVVPAAVGAFARSLHRSTPP